MIGNALPAIVLVAIGFFVYFQWGKTHYTRSNAMTSVKKFFFYRPVFITSLVIGFLLFIQTYREPPAFVGDITAFFDTNSSSWGIDTWTSDMTFTLIVAVGIYVVWIVRRWKTTNWIGSRINFWRTIWGSKIMFSVFYWLFVWYFFPYFCMIFLLVLKLFSWASGGLTDSLGWLIDLIMSFREWGWEQLQKLREWKTV